MSTTVNHTEECPIIPRLPKDARGWQHLKPVPSPLDKFHLTPAETKWKIQVANGKARRLEELRSYGVINTMDRDELLKLRDELRGVNDNVPTLRGKTRRSCSDEDTKTIREAFNARAQEHHGASTWRNSWKIRFYREFADRFNVSECVIQNVVNFKGTYALDK